MIFLNESSSFIVASSILSLWFSIVPGYQNIKLVIEIYDKCQRSTTISK